MHERPSRVEEARTNHQGWRRWLPRFSLRGLLIFQAAIAALLALAYWWPKSEQLQNVVPPSDDYMGFYRGLGLIDTVGFFGKDYYRFRMLRGGGDPDEIVTVAIFYDGEEYSPFRGYYPDGTLREEGMCPVEFSNGRFPLPMPGYSKEGRFYKPDGTLGSEIIDGTGIATIWNVDGVKMSEWRIENYEFVSWIHYDLEGNVTKHTP